MNEITSFEGHPRIQELAAQGWWIGLRVQVEPSGTWYACSAFLPGAGVSFAPAETEQEAQATYEIIELIDRWLREQKEIA